MPLYQVNSRQTGAQQSITTTFKTVIAITSATGALRRGKCMEIIYGADGAPNATDCQIVYDVSRQTAAGTSTVATPTPVDPNDVAAGSIANINFSVEGTVTASSSVWESSLNQRASQRWTARDEVDALIWPATNLAGLAFRALSPTYASPVLMSAKFLE